MRKPHFIACVALVSAFSALAVSLHISQESGQVAVVWTTQAINFTLESTTNLADGPTWQEVTNAPSVSGSNHVVMFPTPETTRFFRLRKPASTSPVIANLQAPVSLGFGDSVIVTFDYVDAECDVAFLEITRSNAIENVTESIPAELLGLTNVLGQATLPLSGRNMPSGTNTFTLRLRDWQGNLSAIMTFEIALSGTGGGTAPIVTNFVNVSGLTILPVGPHDRARAHFSYGYFDPDGDIERVRYRIIHPGGHIEVVETAVGQKVLGTNGTVQTPLLTFRSTNAPGFYMVELTPIDRNGHVGNTATNLAFLSASPGAALRITSFSPTQGVAGAVVTLAGGGFIANTASNQVSLADIPCEVTSVTTTNIKVIVPEGAGTGRFVVRNSRGLAMNTNFFHVPASVTITPANAQVGVNQELEFSASVVSFSPVKVDWKVNGVVGGDAGVGMISSNGLYVAPANVPPGGTVTISATLTANPGIGRQASVAILPLPTPGTSTVPAVTGGTVRSEDDRAAVVIPPGALPTNTTISVVEWHDDLPSPGAGNVVAGAAEFGPEGLVFNTPVAITIPLVRYHAPGTLLSLQLFNPTNETYVDEGVVATVAANGEQASALVSHFSLHVLLAAAASGPAPIITGIMPASAQEGTRTPVLILGSNLTPDLTLEVLTNGVPVPNHILPGTLHLLTNQAGVLLQIQPIRDLTEGQTRIYTLRLKRPGGAAMAEVDFEVSGLDELIVEHGQIRTLVPAENKRYSAILVKGLILPDLLDTNGILLPPGALVAPPSGPLNLEATGPVIARGVVISGGRHGESGNLRAGGAGGTGSQFGGAGGFGRKDNGNWGFIITFDDDANDGAEPENFGGPGNEPRPLLSFPFGTGGAPGVNHNALENLIPLVAEALACFGSGGIGSSFGCIELTSEVMEIAASSKDFLEGNGTGRQGWPGLPRSSETGFGNGGGGGGGGGRIFVVIDYVYGGGGGGGGAGGRPTTIVTGNRMEMSFVNSQGGNGGDGSNTGVWETLFGDVAIGFEGGGGGGGSAGDITLVAAGGIIGPTNAAKLTGGKPGDGGISVRNSTDGSARKIIFTGDRLPPGAPGTYRETNPNRTNSATPVFIHTNALGAAETDHKVAERALLDVHFQATDPNNVGRTLRIVHDGGTNEMSVLRGTNSTFTKRVLLADGFNTLSVEGMHPLLHKRILAFILDADGDGLSTADEADLGSDPNDTDTDDDGLIDGQEGLAGSDPLDPDSDDDGLGDFEEVNGGTSPLDNDSDDDGYEDGAEVLLGSNPLLSSSVPIHIPSHVLFANSGGQGGVRLTVIDPATGRFGLLGHPNGLLGFGLAFDSQPALYVSRFSNLATHQPFTDVTTQVGPFGGSINMTTIAYDPVEDRLYGVEDGPGPNFEPTGQLVVIDLYTGAGTRIGLATNPVHALCFDSTGALFAAVEGAVSSDRFVKLDPQTGAVLQDIGLIGATPVFGLTVATGGVIYASHRLSNDESELLTIDPATGAGTVVTNVQRAVFGLTSPSVRLFSSVVSVNGFNTATGNKVSEGPFITSNGRFVGFSSQATDLILDSVTDTNNIYDSFVRDLEAGTTDLISVNRFGTTIASTPPDFFGGLLNGISEDGRYAAFRSRNTNVVALPKTNTFFALFRRDRFDGTTTPVNVNSSGTDFANGELGAAVMSSDGRYIVFDSPAANLANDNNGSLFDVFVRDMNSGTTVLASINSGGTGGGNAHSRLLAGSADGRYVYFTSQATDLATVDGPIHGFALFVRDLQSQTTTVLALNPTDTNSPAAPIARHGLTPTNGFVLFTSIATNLTAITDTNGIEDVFVRDLLTGVATLINTNLAGVPTGIRLSSVLAELAVPPGMSADGRYVAFHTTNNNMVSIPDTNNTADVFLRDNQTGEVRLLSVNHTGTGAGDSFSYNPVISRDGRRVVFLSQASDLVSAPPDTNGFVDVFVHDVAAGTTTLLSYDHRRNGSTGIGSLGADVALSGTGDVVVFTSGATNLVRLPDTNNAVDVFFRRLAP